MSLLVMLFMKVGRRDRRDEHCKFNEDSYIVIVL